MSSQTGSDAISVSSNRGYCFVSQPRPNMLSLPLESGCTPSPPAAECRLWHPQYASLYTAWKSTHRHHDLLQAPSSAARMMNPRWSNFVSPGWHAALWMNMRCHNHLFVHLPARVLVSAAARLNLWHIYHASSETTDIRSTSHVSHFSRFHQNDLEYAACKQLLTMRWIPSHIC